MFVVRSRDAGVLRSFHSYWSRGSLGDREPLSPMFYIGVYAAVSTYQFFEDLRSHLIFQRPDH